MKLQLIRNATMKIEYSGKTILTDPFLGSKFLYESFVGKSLNPTVDLPCSPTEVLKGVELCIVSHLHPDHFDPAAIELMNKDIQILCQPGDNQIIRSAGFTKVEVINNSIKCDGIEITRTGGMHGIGMWSQQLGNVSGFLFKSENEPIVYWTGDTVWYADIEKTINEFKPEIIITHSGGASFVKGEPIIMDEVQTLEVCKASPNSKVIAIHLESLDHLTVTRSKLREFADQNGVGSVQLLIPEDGEIFQF
jgi:L-ascorbate metabolism protein UlaG (beta-lactamase superfamily)